jgi:deoxyribodipyrimidine photolyase-related protein
MTLNFSKMASVFLIFPHQLFKDISLLKEVECVYLIEEYLYFSQYKFHKQKLVLHRASMKYYENYLQKHGINVNYIQSTNKQHDIRILLDEIHTETVEYYDVCDNWLDKRIVMSCAKNNIKTKEYPTPLFINSKKDLHDYFGTKQKYFQTDFYTQQRKKLNILVDENGKPKGGKWSFDAENRLKYPTNKVAPKIEFPIINDFYKSAIEYVEANFPNNYGIISLNFIYPTTHNESESWLQQFLETRFKEFGDYEDAIVDTEKTLHHSILTPMLNIGLLLPMQIVNAAIAFASENNVPLNSLEGFIRQIIGWREFIRGVYIYKGTEERTSNFWKFKKQIPSSFYTANTGIEPIDATIKKLLQTGYNHHIERLMILGNFMLLCEFHPNAVYKWFMEMYVDSYDWVMVTNVYGMSQFADGGIMATKPYISGSSYVLKMSNYKKGNWYLIWDALFWNFMNKHRHFFLSNPRLGMLIKTYDKMSDEKKQGLNEIAIKYFMNL